MPPPKMRKGSLPSGHDGTPPLIDSKGSDIPTPVGLASSAL